MAKERNGATRLTKIGDLGRRLAKIGRDIDRTQPKAGKHRLDHLIAILGLHQNAIALADALRSQRRSERVNAPIDLCPAPLALAPDKTDLSAEAARRLAEHMSEIHHAFRGWSDAAFGRHGSAAKHERVALQGLVMVDDGTPPYFAFSIFTLNLTARARIVQPSRIPL